MFLNDSMIFKKQNIYTMVFNFIFANDSKNCFKIEHLMSVLKCPNCRIHIYLYSLYTCHSSNNYTCGSSEKCAKSHNIRLKEFRMSRQKEKE